MILMFSAWSQKDRRKKWRIQQLDGPQDAKDHVEQVAKKHKSAAEKWDRQMKELRRMRQPKHGKTKEADRTNRNEASVDNMQPSNRRSASSTNIANESSNVLQPELTDNARVQTLEHVSSHNVNSNIKVKAPMDIPFRKPANGNERNQTTAKPISYADAITPTSQRVESTEMPFFLSSARPDMLEPNIHLNDSTQQNLFKSTQAVANHKFHMLSKYSQTAPIEKFRETIQEFIYKLNPPDMREFAIEKKETVYREPFYSKASDQPKFPTVFSGKEFRLPVSGIASLKEFDSFFSLDTQIRGSLHKFTRIREWTPTISPPTFSNVKDWIKSKTLKHELAKSSNTQVSLQFYFIQVFIN